MAACAPCKIILDEGVAAELEGRNPNAAMALASAKLLDRLDDDVIQMMIDLDYDLLEGKVDERQWRKGLFKALRLQAAGRGPGQG